MLLKSVSVTVSVLAVELGIAFAKECTVESTGQGDDSANILQAFQDCASDSVITFQARNYRWVNHWYTVARLITLVTQCFYAYDLGKSQ